MTVTVHPTLDLMSTIYRLPTEGGPESVRFRSYVELAGSGHQVHAYNPMTSNPAALETVEALRALDAEKLVGEVLEGVEGLGQIAVAVVVLTPGAWTDRLFTELRNRTSDTKTVWFWSGEPITHDSVVAMTRAEAARMLWRRGHGAPTKLIEFASQEAVALNAAGFEPAHANETVSEVLEVLGESTDDGTLIAFMAGDEQAEGADWSGLGLSADEGPRTVARWLNEQTSWREALRTGWTPTP